MSKFVERTIRNGEVTIYGRRFRPQDDFMKYDGRLNGQRYVFGLYPISTEDVMKGYISKYVFCWGAADESKRDPWGDELVDGTFPWQFWYNQGHPDVK